MLDPYLDPYFGILISKSLFWDPYFKFYLQTKSLSSSTRVRILIWDPYLVSKNKDRDPYLLIPESLSSSTTVRILIWDPYLVNKNKDRDPYFGNPESLSSSTS